MKGLGLDIETRKNQSLGLELELIEDNSHLSIPLPHSFHSPAVLPSPGFCHPRLAFDVALGVEDENTIRSRYSLAKEEFDYILLQPSFRNEVATHCSVMRETGVTFAVKAKLIAEEKMEDMYEIISDKFVDAKTRVAAWIAVTRAAGLEERVGVGGVNANAQTVNIQINY